MKEFGFIGVGNMGGALARALCRKEGSYRVSVSNRTPEKAIRLAAELECKASDNSTIAETCDYIFLGVKPQMFREMLEGIRPALESRKEMPVLVSMAAGTSMEKITGWLGKEYPVLRIMPNTPVSVGEGVVLYCANALVTEEQKEEFLDHMAFAGRFVELKENLIDTGGVVSSCAPAFADLFMEALADGGVACGLPRAAALELAAQMLVGTGKLALATGDHPGKLKDAVCSPAGSTIQGVRALEKGGFRSAVIEAVIASDTKNKNM